MFELNLYLYQKHDFNYNVIDRCILRIYKHFYELKFIK